MSHVGISIATSHMSLQQLESHNHGKTIRKELCYFIDFTLWFHFQHTFLPSIWCYNQRRKKWFITFNAPLISIKIKCTCKLMWQMNSTLCHTLWCFKNFMLLKVTLFDFYILFIVLMHLNFGYFYNNEVIIILSAMGTHQGNFFHEPLFGLTHFWTLQFAKVQFPICLFPTIVDGIHIISLPSIGCINIEFIFLKFNYEIGLSIQLHKCELFCPHQAYLMISPFQLCLTPLPKTSNFWIFQWGLFCSLLLSSMMHYQKTLSMQIYYLGWMTFK